MPGIRLFHPREDSCERTYPDSRRNELCVRLTKCCFLVMTRKFLADLDVTAVRDLWGLYLVSQHDV